MLSVRYYLFALSLALFLALLLASPTGLAAEGPDTSGLSSASDASGRDNDRSTAAVARAARSGPVFGLAAIAAYAATRAARNPVPVFSPGEFSDNSPAAVNSATNILLNTAKTTDIGVAMVPVVNAGSNRPVRTMMVAAAAPRRTIPTTVIVPDGPPDSGTTERPIRFPQGSGATALAQKVIEEGLTWMGTPYIWGGASRKGVDCSSLVMLTFRKGGINLPRTSNEQATQGNRVAYDDLVPGDLVFFNTLGRRISHVGIYIGNGRFLHAPSTGNFVRIDKLYSKYWSRRYVTARRVLNDGRQPDLPQTQIASRVNTPERNTPRNPVPRIPQTTEQPRNHVTLPQPSESAVAPGTAIAPPGFSSGFSSNESPQHATESGSAGTTSVPAHEPAAPIFVAPPASESPPAPVAPVQDSSEGAAN